MAQSRLTKKQQQKMVRQTVFIVLASIVLLIAFLFFIIPQLTRIAGNILDGGTLGEPEDTIPPQVPILSAPIDATNSARLPVSGVGEAGAKAVFVLNGAKLDTVKINDDGTFSYDLPLSEGDNVVTVYSIDQADNESVQTHEYSIELDTEAPELSIEEPEDGSTIELRRNQLTTIKGTTEPTARVYVNDRLLYAGSDGSFSTSYELQEGENKIMIRSVDNGGNVTEKELTVNFKL